MSGLMQFLEHKSNFSPVGVTITGNGKAMTKKTALIQISFYTLTLIYFTHHL